MSTNSFEELVNARRSVRVFTKEEVPDEVIEKSLNLALLAPNSSNLQPWKFYWLKDKASKEKVQHFCFNQLAAKTAPTLIVATYQIDTWRENAKMILKELYKNSSSNYPSSLFHYYDTLVPGSYELTLWKKFANIIYKNRIRPREPLNKADMKIWACKSSTLACENLMLAVKSFGFDSCPMEGYDSYKIRDFLKLGKNEFINMVISVGRQEPLVPNYPRIRLDPSNFIKKI